MIRSIVAEAILTRLSDPRIAPVTSVTRVDVSPDFSTAQIHVSVMADEAQRKLTLRGLEHAGGRLRAMVGEQITLRKVPRLIFKLDDSVRRGAEMVETLDALMEAQGEQPSWAIDPGADADEPDPAAPVTDDAADRAARAARRTPEP